MSIKVMIIDGHADFRSLLMHHVTTHWPDAMLLAYDPLAAGPLSEGFSGAGNDIVLLGNHLGEHDGPGMIARFRTAGRFPPIIYFGEESERGAAEKAGATAFFPRKKISHDALIIKLSDLMRAANRMTRTGSLFVGDAGTGIQPLIRGYRFIRKLAVTDHSAVYLCEREAEGINVVLKVLQQIPDATDSVGAFDRFLQEYELIAELNHPNIVRIYGLGVADDHAHIAMEYLAGGNLRRRIDEGVAEPDAVRFVKQIAGAIGEIHKIGVLHRDLKPGNIMLRDDNTVGLIDFGLAKRLRLKMALTGSGEIFGTPYYMSPEQGHGDPVDGRSDIYSLGVIFYELLTGEKPFLADTAMGIIYKHAKVSVPRLPDAVAHHQATIDRMLAKKPEDRFQIADQVIEAL